INEIRYFPGGATWEVKAVVSPKASAGEKTITLKDFRIVVCDKDNCLPPKKVPISAKLTVLEGTQAVDPKYKQAVEKSLGGSTHDQKKEAPAAAVNTYPQTRADTSDDEPKEVALKIAKARDYALDVETVKAILPKVETRQAGFVAFVLTAMFW